MNIVDPILFQAKLNPAAPAICVPGAARPLISYGRLERAIHNIGRAALSAGLARGQVAAIHVTDKIFHAALILGLARIGVVTMSARSRSFPPEIGVDAVIVDAAATYQNAKRVVVADQGAWMDARRRRAARRSAPHVRRRRRSLPHHAHLRLDRRAARHPVHPSAGDGTQRAIGVHARHPLPGLLALLLRSRLRHRSGISRPAAAALQGRHDLLLRRGSRKPGAGPDALPGAGHDGVAGRLVGVPEVLRRLSQRRLRARSHHHAGRVDAARAVAARARAHVRQPVLDLRRDRDRRHHHRPGAYHCRDAGRRRLRHAGRRGRDRRRQRRAVAVRQRRARAAAHRADGRRLLRRSAGGAARVPATAGSIRATSACCIPTGC